VTKKSIGYIISILLITAMVVMMVKPNIDKSMSSDTLAELDTNEVVGLEKGDTPPDFELKTMDGDLVRLSDLKGKKVILNFWASWCGPCKAEMPHMEQYYQKHKESANVEIIAVNLTTAERRGLEGVTEFIDTYGLTFPIPLDEDGKASEDYSVFTIPTTYLLGTDGKLAQKFMGPMDENMMEELVDNLK